MCYNIFYLKDYFHFFSKKEYLAKGDRNNFLLEMLKVQSRNTRLRNARTKYKKRQKGKSAVPFSTYLSYPASSLLVFQSITVGSPIPDISSHYAEAYFPKDLVMFVSNGKAMKVIDTFYLK